MTSLTNWIKIKEMKNEKKIKVWAITNQRGGLETLSENQGMELECSQKERERLIRKLEGDGINLPTRKLTPQEIEAIVFFIKTGEQRFSLQDESKEND